MSYLIILGIVVVGVAVFLTACCALGKDTPTKGGRR